MIKYFKPASVTWWASATPLGLGLLSATEPVHGAVGVTQIIGNMTGGVEPYVLINAGLAGIGLRGALK
jgi:hypothetical protein